MWEHDNQPKDQLQRRNHQEWGQRDSGKDDSEGGKSRGNTVTTAASMIVRGMRQDEGNTATMSGYCGNSGDEVDSNSGGNS